MQPETYQLRLPPGKSLDSLIETLARNLWIILEWQPGFTKFNNASLARMLHAIRQVVEKYVHAYDICGRSPVCDAGKSAGPWMKAAFGYVTPPAQPRPPRCLIVDLPYGLEEFLQELEATALVTLFHDSDHLVETSRLIKSLWDTSIKKTLGPFLYDHPSCGHDPICEQRMPAKLWAS
jgi:hypothetical protein